MRCAPGQLLQPGVDFVIANFTVDVAIGTGFGIIVGKDAVLLAAGLVRKGGFDTTAVPVPAVVEHNNIVLLDFSCQFGHGRANRVAARALVEEQGDVLVGESELVP